MKTLAQIQIEAIGMRRHLRYYRKLKKRFPLSMGYEVIPQVTRNTVDIRVLHNGREVQVYELTNYKITSEMSGKRFKRYVDKLRSHECERFLVVSFHENLMDSSYWKHHTPQNNPSIRQDYHNNPTYGYRIGELNKHHIQLVVEGYQD